MRDMALGARKLLAAAGALVLFTGCAGQPSQDGNQNGQVAIGIDLPLSGADASDGIPTRNGALLAIDEANAAHLLGTSVKIVAKDLDDAVNGKHDPAQGAQNVKTFLSDESVLGMIGPFNSSVATAEIPITNDGGLAQISPSATADGLTRGIQAANLRRSHPDVNAFFRVCATEHRQGAAAAHFARSLGYTSVFVIDDNETYGKGLADVFAARFLVLGGTVLGHEHITSNQQDFKSLLTKVRATQPSLVFFGGTTSTGGGLIRKQMADVDLGSVGFFGGDGISDGEFLTVAGPAADGVAYTVVAPDVTHLSRAKSFMLAYRQQYHTAVGAYSANAYSATQILLHAIASAMKRNDHHLPSRAQVLTQVAASKNILTPIGTVGFDKFGDTTAPIVSLYQIKDGQPHFLGQGVAQ